MKTQNRVSKILKMLALGFMAMSLANCAKSDGGSSSGTTTTTGTYQTLNGLCYLNNNGTLTQQSDTSKCANTTTGTYQLLNGVCYQVVNGQYIAQANVSTCTTANTQSSQVCSGYYWDSIRWWNCGVEVNCSGYTLQSQQGQVVRCQ